VDSVLRRDVDAAPRPTTLTRADFPQLFASSTRFAWRVLARMGVAPSDLSDVCQEVFVVVYRRLDDFDGRASPRSWIYGICVRVASEYRRRRRARPELLGGDVPEVPFPAEQAMALDRKRAHELLQASLEQLDDDKRAVFVLFEIEELTMSEVSEALGVPLQTAYSRLHAARKLITARFRRAGVTGGPE
jgi:RNA polymerase sigma-70 factor (ECF subfamily)